MPKRRANDAQVERLLAALKSNLSYRQQVARRIAQQNNIKYDSAMRRLQRYITEAGEKRSIHAPAAKESRRELRADARRHTPPRAIVYEPGEQEQIARDRDFGEYDEEEGEEEEGDFDSYEVTLNDLRAVVGYHDGDITETAERLNLSPRGEKLLDLGTGGVDVLNMRGGGELQDRVREFYNDLETANYQDIEDFASLFFNLPDWEISMILDDIRSGATTFDEWLDAWHHDGMTLDDLTDSEFWELFREAYERTQA